MTTLTTIKREIKSQLGYNLVSIQNRERKTLTMEVIRITILSEKGNDLYRVIFKSVDFNGNIKLKTI